MKITNKHSIPEDIYKAVVNDSYVREKKIFSVTELIGSPRSVQLERRHEDEIEVDVVDRVRIFSGNCFHTAMEKSNNRHYGLDARIEKRLYADVNGQAISGTADLHKDRVLADYKETSVWKYVNSGFTDWIRQLNCYAYIFNVNGITTEKIVIRVKFYDWKPNDKIRYGASYPNAPIMELEMPLWSIEDTKQYLEERVHIHTVNAGLDDEHLDMCTTEEMWEKPTIYAVYKNDNKKATKLFEDEDEATGYVKDFNEKQSKALYSVVIRPGIRVKCESYCNVSSFCN